MVCIFTFSSLLSFTATPNTGIYCAVFGLSIHVLFCHNSSAHKLYKGCTIALFILATIYTAVDTWGICQQTLLAFNAATAKDYTPYLQYGHGGNGKTACMYVKTVIIPYSHIESFQIHRCYIIFNSHKFILYPLISIAFILNDFIDISDWWVQLLSGLQNVNCYFVNEAGRIWWITSEARKLGARSTHSRFNNIMAIIIESAMLYAGSLLTTVILGHIVWNPTSVDVVPFDFGAVSSLVSVSTP
ncbi:hypothetical protein L218DRAFT_871334 [Marasmius fiardii PR-910]|nr:hypothetical protein L218DRAFT_871334 [Marasmius fiardii PR-910]